MAEFEDERDALAEFGLDTDGVVGNIAPLGGANTNQAERNVDIQEMVNAWRSEVSSPEILPFKEDLVHRFRNMLKVVEEELEAQLEEFNKDTQDLAEKMAIHDIYLMDMERVKYSLARYLRVRILKIENMVHYITNNMDHYDRLSDEEKEFLITVNRINTNYFEDQITRKVQHKPVYKKYLKTMQDDLVAHAEPDLGTYVFAVAEQDVDVVTMDNKTLTLNASSAVAIDYMSIKEKVYANEVNLL
jgi:hypothetical protein